ncbi:TPA: DUF1071 domain-containing protein [Burkholderia vietnamiensis]|nr:DUF1071 domain-containing protein [Burkholderia vietnamiensis]
MENKSFFEAFGATINAAEVANKNGLSYIAAATAMRLAGRPEVQFVDFDGKPYLEMLGGAVVAVDINVPGSTLVQRMWLPVMDQDNQPLSLTKMKLTDVNNNRQRCLVKAIAALTGHGLSLYMGHDGDGAAAVARLGITPETDLETATPVVATLKEGGAPYIEWNVGLAACRITDANFHWEVVMWDGKPYREVLGGLLVDVDTVYDGMRQRLSLPVMDAAFQAVPSGSATVFDWNKAVMRALTKCIAFNTGYGLSVYAEEFGDDESKGGKGRKGSAAKPKAAAKVEPAQAESAPAEAATAATERAAETVAESQGEAAVEAKADAAVVDAGVAAEAAATEQPAARVEVTAPVEAAAPAATTATATAEVAAPKATVAAADSEAVSRFRDVMRKRKEVNGVAGIISLYPALATSTKFADEDKPACFAVLVTASASLIDEANILDLLNALREYRAMDHLAIDNRDMVAAKLTSVMLTTACAAGDDALKAAPEDLVSAGVAQDVDDVLRLAALGNVPVETVDLLRDVLELASA